MWPRLERRRTHHEPDSSRTERNRSSGSKKRVSRGWSSSHPAQATVRHGRTTGPRPAPRLEHAYIGQDLALVRTAPRTASWSHDRKAARQPHKSSVTQHYRSPPLPSPAHRPWACQPCAGAAAIHAPTPRWGRVVREGTTRGFARGRRSKIHFSSTPRSRAAAPAAKDRVTKSSGGRVCAGARQPRRAESQSRAAGGFERALARWAPCERL